MLTMLTALEHSTSAFLAIDLHSYKIVAQNKVATELFSSPKVPMNLGRLLGGRTSIGTFMKEMKEHLKEDDKYHLDNTTAANHKGEEFECDMEYGYITYDNKFVYLKVRPITDTKQYYLEKFVETRTRPAFTLDVKNNLKVTYGNDAFFRCFACDKVSIQLKYQSLFEKLLAEDGREDYVDLIKTSIQKESVAILDVPVKTARGDTLYVYFNKDKLKQVDPEGKHLFCFLANSGDTLEDLDDPFTSREDG